MSKLPVDMFEPLPTPEAEKPKPKVNENEIFAVPKKEEEEKVVAEPVAETNEIETPKPVTKKAPRGKSQDPEHLKKMREASVARRAQRKKDKEEAERIIAEAKAIKEQQLAQKMSQPSQSSNPAFDYDKLAEALERRRKTQAPVAKPQPQVPSPAQIDYKKKYEQSQVQLFEQRVRADERKRIQQERQTKINTVAANNLKVPKALRKYQERANQYAESQKDNPWDSFFK